MIRGEPRYRSHLMSKEELLLTYWHKLSAHEQDDLLELARSLIAANPVDRDQDFGAPEQLQVRSQQQLEMLIQEGLSSLEQGQGIAATDEWWEQERQRLLMRALNP